MSNRLGLCSGGFRYALYRSYVLLAGWPIEPISHAIRAWVPLTKAQRIEEVTYESPALPLSYFATAAKFIERDPERQPQRRIWLLEQRRRRTLAGLPSPMWR